MLVEEVRRQPHSELEGKISDVATHGSNLMMCHCSSSAFLLPENGSVLSPVRYNVYMSLCLGNDFLHFLHLTSNIVIHEIETIMNYVFQYISNSNVFASIKRKVAVQR